MTRRRTTRERVRRPKGDGSIAPVRPGSDRWSVRVVIDGQRRRLPGGPWETEDQARQALIRWQADQQALTPVPGSLAPTAETAPPQPRERLLKDVYVESLTVFGGLDAMSTDRRTFYRNVITGDAKKNGKPITGRIILGDYPLDAVSLQLLQQWSANLRATGEHQLKASTVAKWARHLHQCFDWAVEAKYIDANPVALRRLVPRGEARAERPPRHFLTLPEMWTLRVWAHDDDADLVLTLLFSGMRQGEIRALTPESLLTGPVPLVRVTSTIHESSGVPTPGPPKTRGSRRNVAIPKPLMERLRARVRQQGVRPGQPLFPGRSGTWMRGDWLNRRFRLLCDEAGLVGHPLDSSEGRQRPPAPHDLRATGASLLLAAGVPVPEVQAWLGHSTPQMTLGLYAEVQQMGEEDPILTSIRGKGLTLSETLTEVYNRSNTEYVEFVGFPYEGYEPPRF